MRAARPSLKHSLADAGDLTERFIHAKDASLALSAAMAGTVLTGGPHGLIGSTVLLITHEQFLAGLALIELDGVAKRIVVCPPDLKREYLAQLIATAGIDAVVTDLDRSAFPTNGVWRFIACGLPLSPCRPPLSPQAPTEWVMLTSGTTGVPKMVAHGRDAITGAIIPSPAAPSRPPVWGTFYDIRRYGGLQIFLRAVLGTGSLVLSSAGEDGAEHLKRLARHGVTHLTGTPSHWRRALMSTEARLIDPDYVRLSGEIADQTVLDNLRKTYPRAAIGHAYASTEAGVGFEVTDEREGFPASFLGQRGDVAMKIEDGSLRIRSSRTGSLYMGGDLPSLLDDDGFVDTDDLVETRGDRCYFIGRRSGIINVGGLKVHPEEVEAIINRHERVRMSLVKGRTNPITGSIVVADVVLNDGGSPLEETAPATVKKEILDLCRAELAQHKIPVLVRFIPSLEMTTAGKLARHHA